MNVLRTFSGSHHKKYKNVHSQPPKKRVLSRILVGSSPFVISFSSSSEYLCIQVPKVTINSPSTCVCPGELTSENDRLSRKTSCSYNSRHLNRNSLSDVNEEMSFNVIKTVEFSGR